METTRTYRAKILNHNQVSDDLDRCGFAASKLWNVGRWYIQEKWDETGEIPGEAELKSELKSHERYKDLHSQTSQRVLEELSEAFKGWFEKRKNGDEKANPPGYRKRGDQHPKSTVTWKQKGIKHDTQNNRVRLSKGFNLKNSRDDYILCEYQTRPDIEVENVQQVRAVWNGDNWELHLVCKVTIPVDEAPGTGTAGIDLGINNYIAIAYDDGDTELYPGNSIKQDKHYFTREEYRTEGENGPSQKALWARQKLSRRKQHFLHTLSKHIVKRCVEKGIGEIAVGNLKDIRNDEETGESRDWGKAGNKKLHGWEFERFTTLLEYKAERHGILVERVDEENTSKTCSNCGRIDGKSRVHRGLYICRGCGTRMNADINAAENIRRKITQNPLKEASMGNGPVAGPTTRLFDTTAGTFQPQEQAMGCEP